LQHIFLKLQFNI